MAICPVTICKHWQKVPLLRISLPIKVKRTHQSPLDESYRKLSKSDFIYHEEDNTFTCPGGQTLNLVRQSKESDRVYQGNTGVCANCPYQPPCCQSQKGEARTINIPMTGNR